MKTNKKPAGTALAMTLLALAMMVLLVAGLNQVVVTQQKSAANNVDYLMAQSYAQMALLDAEFTVRTFDYTHNMENKDFAARIYEESHVVTINNTCESSGWCYSSLGQAWQPWLKVDTSANVVAPCNSYTESGMVPVIDERSSIVNAHVYTSGDSSLCSQPRYIMEMLNPNFIGRSNLADNITAGAGQERGNITQSNGAIFVVYKNGDLNLAHQPSGRLYRITVRAFGKNGNTRVTLQEYLVITTRNGATISTSDIIPLSVRWLY
jgi:Tfp pilus assembly protein PilX